MKETSFLFVSCANKMGISLQNYKSSLIKDLLLCAAFSTGKLVIILQPMEKFNRKPFFNF